MSSEKASSSTPAAEAHETLTFGELAEGDLFIGFPVPGDNAGHGGYRGTSVLFRKTEANVTCPVGWETVRYGIPTGRSVSMNKGAISDCPHSMRVLRVL